MALQKTAVAAVQAELAFEITFGREKYRLGVDRKAALLEMLSSSWTCKAT